MTQRCCCSCMEMLLGRVKCGISMQAAASPSFCFELSLQTRARPLFSRSIVLLYMAGTSPASLPIPHSLPADRILPLDKLLFVHLCCACCISTRRQYHHAGRASRSTRSLLIRLDRAEWVECCVPLFSRTPRSEHRKMLLRNLDGPGQVGKKHFW